MSWTSRCAPRGAGLSGNAGDPEAEDVRAAFAGPLSVVYVANRLTRRLSVPGIVWFG